MKVLIVTTTFPRWKKDHRAPYLLELTRHLTTQGIKVRVLTIHFPGALDHEEWDGIEIIRSRYLPEKLEILQKDDGGIPEALQKNPLSIIVILPVVISLFISIIRYSSDCDLIHAQWTLAGFIACISQPFHKKQYLLTVHGSDINKSKKKNILIITTRFVINHSATTIAVSNSLYNSILQMGVNAKKICVIPDGVDTKRFQPILFEHENILITIGALTINKGGKILLDALPRVFDSYPEYQLIWIGSGPQLATWKKIASQYKIQERISFIGNQAQDEIVAWLQRARLMILPSLSEGFGVVLLEALACGVPCVGSNVGGIPDIITNEVGDLVPANDPSSLAKSIITLLTDKETLVMKGKVARKRAVEMFDWEIVSLKIIDLYTRSIESKNQR